MRQLKKYGLYMLLAAILLLTAACGRKIGMDANDVVNDVTGAGDSLVDGMDDALDEGMDGGLDGEDGAVTP